MSYQHLFGFTHLPFKQGCSAERLFTCSQLDELHARLRFLVEHQATGLLTGEPGCGKSTALRRLRETLNPEQVKLLYLFDNTGSERDFCAQIALELGIEPVMSRVLTLRAIQREIRRLVEERHLDVLLLIDEAQGLRTEVLDLLPRLTNFEWDARSRIAILLAGQSGLRQKLRLAHLEPLAQRITVRFHLKGFDRENTAQYLQHQLKSVGVDRPLFSEAAIEALFTASSGVMRRINLIAHHALALAATQGQNHLEPEHVLKAAEECRA